MQESNNYMGFCEGHVQLMQDIAVVKNTLLSVDKRINGTISNIEKHIEESTKFRDLINKHDTILNDICNLKRWWFGAIGTLFVAILGIAVIWGALLYRIDRLEKLHPIGQALVENKRS